MKITFLGTGTSVGVPVINCQCEVCRSADPRDHRLRTSALVETRGRNFLIDCGPDFRTQMLRLGSPRLDALLVTHTHYDHLGGIDDLRPYCSADHGFPIYCRKEVARDIHVRMPYCFEPHNSHMTLDEALTIVGRVNPRKAYLIHFSHDIGLHAQTSLQLPPNVIMAHDTLSVTL